jgi:hypothetical protein
MARRQRRDYSDLRIRAAHRRAGHEWWKWYVIWKPALSMFGPPLSATAVLMVLWVKVPHLMLGVAALTLAVLAAAGWLIYTGSAAALQRRMNARVAGDRGRGAGLGWAVACLVALFSFTGWLSLWSHWA